MDVDFHLVVSFPATAGALAFSRLQGALSMCLKYRANRSI